VGFLNLANRRNSSVGSFSIPALASLQKASRGPAVKSTVRKPASRSAQTTALRHVATTTGCTASDWSCRNGCVFSYTTCNTKPSPAVRATPPPTIACGRDMKVGTSPGQVAINEACGRAYAEANVRKQDPWVQNLWDWTQGVDRAIRPAVPLISAGTAAARGAARAPDVVVPPKVPLVSRETLLETWSKLDAGKQPNVRQVSTEDELLRIYENWTAGASPVANTGNGGSAFLLADGTRIGWRPTSKSVGPTIDIKIAGEGKQLKIHIGGQV